MPGTFDRGGDHTSLHFGRENLGTGLPYAKGALPGGLFIRVIGAHFNEPSSFEFVNLLAFESFKTIRTIRPP